MARAPVAWVDRVSSVWGKIDRFPLVLLVKGLRIGLFVTFPHPEPALERDIG